MHTFLQPLVQQQVIHKFDTVKKSGSNKSIDVIGTLSMFDTKNIHIDIDGYQFHLKFKRVMINTDKYLVLDYIEDLSEERVVVSLTKKRQIVLSLPSRNMMLELK